MPPKAGAYWFDRSGAERWINPSSLPRLVILAGNDLESVVELRARLSAAFLGIERSSLSREDHDAEEESREEILLSLRSMPMFSTRRAVSIRNAEKLFAEAEHAVAVQEMLENLDEETLVVLSSEESLKELRAIPFFEKLAGARAAGYFYAPRDDDEAENWVRGFCAREKISLTPGAAKALVKLVGIDTGELSQEIRKAAFASEMRVDEKVVREHVTDHREDPAFAWADAVIADSPSAVGLAERATDSGNLALPAMAALNGHWDLILELHRGQESWRSKKLKPFFRKWSPERISRSRGILLDLNIELNSKPAETRSARLELATLRLRETL